MKFQRVKGSYDISFDNEEEWKHPHLWLYLEEAVKKITSLFGYIELRTPIFEYVDVFLRSVGEETDIVSKEMYTFTDRADRTLALRPELTAPIIRAFLENGLHHKKQQRFYYMGPCFRYDRAQKGRYRQFSQFGAEVIGLNDPLIDVEVIQMIAHFFSFLGLHNTTLLINCIGDTSSRETYGDALREYFAPHKEDLSEDSQKRFTKNPLRILDSKDPTDLELAKNAPLIDQFLSNASKDHFAKVLEGLKELNIPYEITPTLVRGLDYYVDTVFEFVTNDDNSRQNTIAAGGRYNGLIKAMGGEDLPGIGFASGMERILQSLLTSPSFKPSSQSIEYYVIPICEEAKLKSLEICNTLRCKGLPSTPHLKNTHLKKGLQAAEALNAKYALILGEDELASNSIKCKNLTTKEEKSLSISSLP